jgi:hypothetical protein
MRNSVVRVVAAMLMASAGSALAEDIKSGPQPGSRVPGPFRPLHVTGPDAGKRVCLYCKYGPRPVAMIFTREVSPAVATLLARVNALTVEREEARLASFAVVLGDTGKLVEPLKQFASRNNIRATVLTVDEAPPESYAIAPDAAVTVILYHHHKVSANHAYRRGELGAPGIEAIVADIRKMLPPK